MKGSDFIKSKKDSKDSKNSKLDFKNDFKGYRRSKIIVMILLTVALVICGLFLNVFGGIGLYQNEYESAGIALFISTGLFFIGYLLLFADTVILPIIFDVLGTGFFIYPINVLLSISNEKIPKQYTEPLAQRIYPAIIISVLLILGAIVNVFSPVKVKKREDKKIKKYNEIKRPLREDEKIV